ncbi:MAG TPA: hypothetical protein DEA58_02590 [Pseudothermotoga sp.]|uniref:PEGA domain-containing protein n=1 Tax=Pseudothermotoga lettingae TaxID=177758 RepID=UPI000746D63C|nr:PEGA domain-containing protein [Pseudothermotoga lettingae]KUK21988.1 MAG: PEGA domain protein [Pseudothermotoga lettingae]HBT25568.1 hypothetical protein [Pseudothermotoga sp.]
MRKTLLVVLALIVAAMSFADMQLKNVIIVPKPSELEVKVWLNKPEGAVYQVNESLNIYFKANKSCYVLIYDIRTDGKITLLFPNKYDSNNYIAPNVTYKLPISNLYSFKITPPEGKEYIQIIASTTFLPIIQQLKNLGTTQSFPLLSEDAENYVQKQIMPYLTGEWASDITYFYVGKAARTGIAQLESNPSGAYVYVDGKYIGRTPARVELDEGQHFATFYYENDAVTETFFVTANRTVVVTGNFVRKTMLNITTTPPRAQIFLDGNYVGLSPLEIEIQPGQHTVLAMKDGYKPFQQSFSVSTGETKNINLTLSPISAQLNVFTTPSGASIYVDGKYVGITRPSGLNVDVEPGTHTITARLSNYEDATLTINVQPDEVRTVNITLSPVVRTGTLNIFTTPVNASIYVDGKYVGVASSNGLTIDVEAGTHRIVASYPDYEDASINVRVNANEVRTVNLTLEPVVKVGTVNINTTPSNAMVYINGYLKGVTPLKIELDYGTYQLVLLKGGYYVEVMDLKVNKQNVTVSTTLRIIQ